MIERFFLVKVELPDWADVDTRIEDIRSEIEITASAATEFYTHAPPVVKCKPVEHAPNCVWIDFVFRDA